MLSDGVEALKKNKREKSRGSREGKREMRRKLGKERSRDGEDRSACGEKRTGCAVTGQNPEQAGGIFRVRLAGRPPAPLSLPPIISFICFSQKERERKAESRFLSHFLCFSMKEADPFNLLLLISSFSNCVPTQTHSGRPIRPRTCPQSALGA